MTIEETRRRAYLDALGFDVWLLKPAEAGPGRLQLAPGEGSVLLVCANAEDSASRLAGDIVRALAGKCVWAWPEPESGGDNPTLADAIGDRLFTRVCLFGPELAENLLPRQRPEVIGSAAVSVFPELQSLAVRGEAKRRFWESILPFLPDSAH